LNHQEERIFGYLIFPFRKNKAFLQTGREEKFRLKSLRVSRLFLPHSFRQNLNYFIKQKRELFRRLIKCR